MIVKELVRILKKQKNQNALVTIAESLLSSDDALVIVNNLEEPLSLDNAEIYL